MSETNLFWAGARVRLTKRARQHGVRPKAPADQQGTVVRISRYGTPRVRWDGLKTVLPYHPDLLELAPPLSLPDSVPGEEMKTMPSEEKKA